MTGEELFKKMQDLMNEASKAKMTSKDVITAIGSIYFGTLISLDITLESVIETAQFLYEQNYKLETEMH